MPDHNYPEKSHPRLTEAQKEEMWERECICMAEPDITPERAEQVAFESYCRKYDPEYARDMGWG